MHSNLTPQWVHYGDIYFFSSTLLWLFLSLPSRLDFSSAQQGWRLPWWGQGCSLCQGQHNMFCLFSYTLIQVLIMFVLNVGERESREVRKTPNRIHQKQRSLLPFRKQNRRWHTHTQPSAPGDRRIIHILYSQAVRLEWFKASLQFP